MDQLVARKLLLFIIILSYTKYRKKEKEKKRQWNTKATQTKQRIDYKFLNLLFGRELCKVGLLWLYSGRLHEWVSSFLTAHQHKIGHSVPYMIKIS